jgi:beta-glucosidase
MSAPQWLIAGLAAAGLASASVPSRATLPEGDGGAASSAVAVGATPDLWRDFSQPPEVRARDLVDRLTLEEKASQVQANPPAIPRLGIPAYSHRNECLHGVVSGNATVFPQAIGMAATWDPALIRDEADAIAIEARAKHNDYVAQHGGDSGEQVGLNFYAPNINIFRDPRWGRGQETYGEDPFLTARFAVAFIRGLQGDDPRYLKAAACAKHFAVHSGPEAQRHRFDAKPSERDLHETYLPAFEAAVREGHVASVMGAYSALNGLPDCADPVLLTDLLRKTWGFDGVVFSDGGAIGDIWAAHQYAATPEAAAAAAVRAGCDVSSGGMGRPDATVTPELLKGGRAFSVLPAAVQRGLISEAQVDAAVTRELVLRFRLGLFDPPSRVPWSGIGIDQSDTPQHRALALKVAQESIVLLKNDGLLPLDREKARRILVVGANAASSRALIGNYTGRPSRFVTILDGIKQVAGPNADVSYLPGAPLALKRDRSNDPAPGVTAEAVAAAGSADVVIYVGGLDASLEREEGRVPYEGFDDGDRTRIELPAPQEELLRALHGTGKPVVFVNCSGSAIAMPWEADHLPAIVQAWYPGEEGGRAVGQVLFGDVDPAGRLPVTFYASTDDLPPFDDYSMADRTYRYFTGKPTFAFGHGLSYAKFEYADARATVASPAGPVRLTFTLTNRGDRDGEEVAQAYVTRDDAGRQTARALCGFARVRLAAGSAERVALDIPVERFRHWDGARKGYVIDGGGYTLLVGSASDDIRASSSVTVSPTGGQDRQDHPRR